MVCKSVVGYVNYCGGGGPAVCVSEGNTRKVMEIPVGMEEKVCVIEGEGDKIRIY